MPIQNARIIEHELLAEMYRDDYFPNDLVDEGKKILLGLCEQIEQQRPQSNAELLALTHAATEAFNELDEKLQAAGSEIETAARDCIGMDFAFIAKAYGFDVDAEDLISPRDW